MVPLGNDEWVATVDIEQPCTYEYSVHAWVDRFESWRRGLAAKFEARQDVSSELLVGAALLRLIATRGRGARAPEADVRWLDDQVALIEGPADAGDRVRAALDDRLASLASRFPDRDRGAVYERVLTVSVDRERARFGAWYEMFPRSWGPDPSRSATFLEAAAHLRRSRRDGLRCRLSSRRSTRSARASGKGRDNALQSDAGGSRQSLGHRIRRWRAQGGGPGLGTLDDFDHFVGEAHRLGLEVRTRHRVSMLAGSSLRARTSGMVLPSTRRHHSIPPKTRPRNTRISIRSTSNCDAWAGVVGGIEIGCRVLDLRAASVDLPGRQSAHQTVPILGMADPRDQAL